MSDKKRLSILSIMLAFCMSLFVLFGPTSANAQTSTNTPASQQANQKNITELVADLSEEEIAVLSKLLAIVTTDEANKNAALVDESADFGETVKNLWQGYSSFMWKNIIALPAAIDVGYRGILRLTTGKFQLFWQLILALGAGAIAELATRKFLTSKSNYGPSNSDVDAPVSLNTLGTHTSLEAVYLAVFVIVSLILTKLLVSNPADYFIASSFILYVLLIIRIAKIFLQYTLAPNTPSMRLVSTDDWNARYIYRNFLILTGVVAIALFLLLNIDQFQIGNSNPFRFWVGQFIYIYLLFVMWRARHGFSDIIRGEEKPLPPGLERVASWWPIISMIVITFQFLIMQVMKSLGGITIGAGASIFTIMLIVLTPFFDTMLRGIIGRLAPKMQSEDDAAHEAAYHATKHSYVRIGRVIFFAALFVIIGKIWGIDYQNLAQLGFGGEVAKRGGGFLYIAAIGYLVWEMTNLWANRQLLKDGPQEEVVMSGEGGGAGKSRLSTVLPLVKMALQTAIIILTVLLALTQLGLNITPLLAGAGVFGLAIGFGAQALVKDIVSGVFFLLDDAFRVGEFIEIEGLVGTVQKISIRSLQLRHPNGPVHVIPYGEIPKLTNNSRDYVILKLRFTVPFDTDLDKVRKLFKKIGQDMMENPDHAENFIQPFKFQGVIDVDDVGIIIRGKFSTKPGAQWMIRKEIYSRVQSVFEENGIHFARREVLVQIPGLDEKSDLKPDQIQAIGTAAAASLETDEEDARPKKDEPF